MKKDNILPYVYDFISYLSEDRSVIENIRRVILFGSAVSEQLDEQSDIDIFIDTKSKDLEDKILKKINDFEYLSDKKWKLRNIDYPIRCITGNIDDHEWKSIKEEIISKGIVLYGQIEQLPEKISHQAIIRYNISRLSQKNKVKFLRGLFGYKNKKNKKIYHHKGLLETIEGEKLESNIIMIPFRNIRQIKDFLNKKKIRYNIIESWKR